ncbi:TetR/AcrR family transcriptional regulator [Compostimonas suwonensis]|uniref:TetR/AcrR family transcriptional regulator n=1 Tax=Compostimonas suwonensis TaxID=1048394 RepID=UPI001FE91BBD|nr:TetR/AcrR family transcriptional regulator [Compostimonas suwonensis]
MRRSINADGPTSASVVRNEPVQQRSAQRLDTLLDAAAVVVDEIGIDRITTAMVAERSGASIGTVYRYFPDRVAVLQALRDRAVLRFRERVIEEIQAAEPPSWLEAVDAALTASVAMYRTEAGFRIVRYDDKVRAPFVGDEEFGDGYFARQLAQLLSGTFGMPESDDLIFHLEVCVEIGNALLGRAFADGPPGDERFISETHSAVRDYLVGHYGEPEPRG